MTRIKICGITNPIQAIAASAAGANYLGLVFAPSRRQVSQEKARDIVNSLRRMASPISVVGVFANTPAEEVNRTADVCRLDWVQLSGDEDWDYCRKMQRPVFKAIHISVNNTARDVMKDIEKGYQVLSQGSLICMLDTQIQGAYGGTGQVFNWQLAEEISQQIPVIVAGGLSPENIGQLIRRVKPWGVDVSSGVETGGQKDTSKIEEFVRQVRGSNR